MYCQLFDFHRLEPFLHDKSCSFICEISSVLWKLKIYYRVKNTLFSSIPNQMNAVRTLTLYRLHMPFNIILASAPESLRTFISIQLLFQNIA
jgi:hypothetical protein